MGKVAASFAAIVALVGFAPAQAQCWTADDVQVAKVRDLQTRLMVASMRCESAGIAMNDQYGAFVTANRAAIATVNQRLRARFWTAFGREDGQRQLDAFTASLVAQHQVDSSEPSACAAQSALSREAAATAGSVSGLIAIADRTGTNPSLPGGVCPVGPVMVRLAAR